VVVTAVLASSAPVAFGNTAGGHIKACSPGYEAVHAAVCASGIAVGMIVGGLALGMAAEQPEMVAGKSCGEKHRS